MDCYRTTRGRIVRSTPSALHPLATPPLSRVAPPRSFRDRRRRRKRPPSARLPRRAPRRRAPPGPRRPSSSSAASERGPELLLAPLLERRDGVPERARDGGGDALGERRGGGAEGRRVARARGRLGADQRVLSSALSNASVTKTNLESSTSRIRDVDVAWETAELVRANILQEVSTKVLAQANMQPELALQLLS